MSSPTDIDLIERYFLGKMTDADIRNFEARLGNDMELARKLRLIKTLELIGINNCKFIENTLNKIFNYTIRE